ncbi:MAG: hypothetical protein HOP30_11150 [Cyclobacteriaceae bacterium]|nr:hypothetical protein [Cyclobacteriaceae bacterium]
MNKLTADDLQRFAELLKSEVGVTIKVIPSDFQRQGVAFLTMHPKDIEKMKGVIREMPISLNPMTPHL